MKILVVLRTLVITVWAVVATAALCIDATYRYLSWDQRIAGSEAEARCNKVKPGSKPERTEYGLICWRNVPVFYFANEAQP